MTVVAVLQARTTSTRLPGKVLADIHGQPMLARQVARIRRSTALDGLVLATSTDPTDDPLEALAADLALPCVRGPLHDVLARYLLAADQHPCDAIVRLTADCPLASPTVIDHVVQEWKRTGVDYASNTQPPSYPDGLDVEVVRPSVLREVYPDTDATEREHVTMGVYRRPERFSLHNVSIPVDLSGWRWTVDTAEDLGFVRDIYDLLPEPFDFEDILTLLESDWVGYRP